MKIYAQKNKVEECVEVLITHEELKILIDSLAEFESKINQYKIANKDKEDLGFTHLHFKDCNKICESSQSDLVFYVDLNEK